MDFNPPALYMSGALTSASMIGQRALLNTSLSWRAGYKLMEYFYSLYSGPGNRQPGTFHPECQHADRYCGKYASDCRYGYGVRIGPEHPSYRSDV